MREKMQGNGKKFDAACIKIAVETREKAIATAWATFSSSMTTAFSTRASALATAWSNTDANARRTAIKDAWKVFHESSKKARETWRSAQKAARKTFRDAAKKCGVATSDASLAAEPENDVNIGD